MGLICSNDILCFAPWRGVCWWGGRRQGETEKGRGGMGESTVSPGIPADQRFMKNGSKSQLAASLYQWERHTHRTGVWLAAARIHFMEKGKKKTAKIICFSPSWVHRNESQRENTASLAFARWMICWNMLRVHREMSPAYRHERAEPCALSRATGVL